MSLLLGCIADDFTGGTDLAGQLVKAGLRTVQTIGVPRRNVENVDAVVVALKSRTNAPQEAVQSSLDALAWLTRQGARQNYFKYCSTFDSTARGNIGPVADALMSALGTDFTVVCPAFPGNGRTIYKGNLFVGDVPLSESGMRNHPLTPMTDSNLVRLLSAQTSKTVGLVSHEIVRRGSDAIRSRLAEIRRTGGAFAVVDAIEDSDLFSIGRACSDLPLVTGGSGLAIGLPQNHSSSFAKSVAHVLPEVSGPSAVISGSCSIATNEQVARMKRERPSFHVDPMAIATGEDVVGKALEWSNGKIGDQPILFYSTDIPDATKTVQGLLGAYRAGDLVERTMGCIAVGLVERGVRRLVVAGGETSGAVVKALRIETLRIGPEIDLGVPWTVAEGGSAKLALALKSGNFGNPDIFLNAWHVLG